MVAPVGVGLRSGVEDGEFCVGRLARGGAAGRGVWVCSWFPGTLPCVEGAEGEDGGGDGGDEGPVGRAELEGVCGGRVEALPTRFGGGRGGCVVDLFARRGSRDGSGEGGAGIFFAEGGDGFEGLAVDDLAFAEDGLALCWCVGSDGRGGMRVFFEESGGGGVGRGVGADEGGGEAGEGGLGGGEIVFDELASLGEAERFAGGDDEAGAVEVADAEGHGEVFDDDEAEGCFGRKGGSGGVVEDDVGHRLADGLGEGEDERFLALAGDPERREVVEGKVGGDVAGDFGEGAGVGGGAEVGLGGFSAVELFLEDAEEVVARHDDGGAEGDFGFVGAFGVEADRVEALPTRLGFGGGVGGRPMLERGGGGEDVFADDVADAVVGEVGAGGGRKRGQEGCQGEGRERCARVDHVAMIRRAESSRR